MTEAQEIVTAFQKPLCWVNIAFCAGMYFLTAKFVKNLKIRASQSPGKLDDELLPLIKKVVWASYGTISAAAVCYSVGITIPGLNAVAMILGGSISMAGAGMVKDGIAVVKLYFQKPVDIGQTIEYEKSDWVVADIKKTDLILTKTKGKNRVKFVPLSDFAKQKPTIDGKWDEINGRVL